MKVKNNKIVLVTGCSSGVGFELVKAFSRDENYTVVGTTRPERYEYTFRKFQSHDLFNQNVSLKKLNLSSEFHLKKTVREIDYQFGGVDILINNAASCFISSIEDSSKNEVIDLMAINFYGPYALCKEVLSSMKIKRRGKILNISSACGFVGFPVMGLYAASKHALEAVTESLGLEVKHYGIRVTSIQPGLIKNNGFRKAVWSKKAKESYLRYNSESSGLYKESENLIRGYRKRFAPDSKVIAQRIKRIAEGSMTRGKYRVTFDSKALFLFSSWFGFNRLHAFVSYFRKPFSKRDSETVLPRGRYSEDLIGLDQTYWDSS